MRINYTRNNNAKKYLALVAFYVFLAYLIPHVVYSQTPYQPEYGDPLDEPWRWIKYDKILDKGILCMTETNLGSFVFGLNKGIITYDGNNWIEQNQNSGFTDSPVRHVAYSEDGFLYAATDSGLFKNKEKKWTKIFPFTDDSYRGLNRIRCLKKMNGKGIVASFEQGLLIYKNDTFTLLVSQKTYNQIAHLVNVNYIIIPDDHCYDNIFRVKEVFCDKQGRFWTCVGTSSEQTLVYYFRLVEGQKPGIVFSKTFTGKDGLFIGNDMKFEQDNEGNIWSINSTFNGGLCVYDGVAWKYKELTGENSFLSITNVNGEIWIGGFGVIYVYKNGDWRTYRRPKTAIPNSKIFVYQDNNGNLWIGGIEGNLVRIDYSGKKWNSLKRLNFHCEDAESNLWYISAEGKVVVNKKDNWYFYDYQDNLPEVPVKIVCLKNGMLAVAGSDQKKASISFFENGKWTKQTFPDISWGVDYRAVFEDREENLWLGCSVNFFKEKGEFGGVVKIKNPGKNNQENTRYLPDDGIHMSSSYGMAQSKDGSVWLGGHHLVRYWNNTWEGYDQIEAFENYINCMAGTEDGTIWVGSRIHGIYRLQNNTWTHYNINTGLLNNTIISILPVAENDVWIATDEDFSRFDGNSWITDVLDSRLTLSREGGDIQCQKNGTIWINRSSRTWKRRALHGNIMQPEDFEYFSAVSLKADSSGPNTVIKTHLNEVSYEGNAFIEWSGRDKWNDTPVSKLQFSYRLNNGNWSHFQYKDNITLVNLKDGEHTFQVRARDLDFNTDTTPAYISFSVLPPVWKQAWFIALIMLFLIVITTYQVLAMKRKKNLEKLNDTLLSKAKEIELKNYILEEQKEQILHQNLEEKELTQSKIRFFTNISHELRTPLSVVTGIIDNLSANSSNDPSDYNKKLSVIKKNSSHLHQLINQIMDFRKFDKETVKLKVSEMDIVQFVHDICFSFKEFAKKYHIGLDFMCAFEHLNTWADRDKIERILYNLVSNAIKYTNEGGLINVRLNTIEIDSVKFVVIDVEDNGKGIPENEVKEIFDIYYKGKTTTEKDLYSSKIGLSIVYDYINMHHGNIRVSSSIDRSEQNKRGYSTRFTVEIPLEKSSYKEIELAPNQTFLSAENLAELRVVNEPDLMASGNSKETRPELPRQPSRPHILVIEDNVDLRWYLVDSLKLHYNVLEAKNGQEGINLSKSVLPDLIISDIMMPEISGTELCHKIKNDIRTSHIPVILLTALTTNERKIEGFETGADDYITKPFSLNLLIARINNILTIRENLKKKFRNEEVINPEEEKVLSMDAVFLKKIRSIVEKECSNPEFNVEDMSRQIGLSSRHLRSKLKVLLDQSPVDFIRAYRIKKAARFLAANTATISEIAYQTGFNDLSYFGKCFIKYYGMSPTDYIKTYYHENETNI